MLKQQNRDSMEILRSKIQKASKGQQHRIIKENINNKN